MVFSTRERTILTLTVVVLGLLGADRYALTPLLNAYNAARTETETLQARMIKHEGLLRRREILEPRWRGMVDGGLTNDPAAAESQTLHAVRRWAEEAGLDITSLKPERSRETDELREITVHVGATGSMREVSRFLWHVETASIPVKIKTLQLGTRREGTDDLTLQFRLSTLYIATAPHADAREEGDS